MQTTEVESSSNGAALSKPGSGLTKKALADLKIKYGDKLIMSEGEGGEMFVFRKPSRAEWKRYQSVLMNDKRMNDRDAAMEQLCYDTLVFPANAEGPEHARLRAAFEGLPAMSLSIIGDLSELAGAAQKTGKI